MGAVQYGPAILAVCVTVLLAVFGLFFRAGRIDSRVESLELWRVNMRNDMRDISNMMEKIGKQITNIETLISERTERRALSREEQE